MQGRRTPSEVAAPSEDAVTRSGAGDDTRLRFLSRIAEQSSEGVGVADMTGTITYINLAGATMLGYDPAELIGQHVSVLHSDRYSTEQVEPMRAKARQEGQATAVLEYQRKDGRSFTGETTLSLLTDDSGAPIGRVRSVRDITARLQAEREQQASRDRLNAIILTLRDLICVLDPVGTVIYASPSCEEAVGIPAAEVVGTNVFALVHPEDCDRVIARTLERLEESPGAPVAPLELRLRHSSGRYLWYEAVANPLPATVDHSTQLAVSLRIVEGRKQLERQLAEQARTDPLTGLANRTRLLAAIEDALAHSAASGTYTAVIYIDLDRFKPVNDAYGHATGDQLLIETARRLSQCLRAKDTAVRVGGDEFVLLLPDLTDPLAAERVARRAHTALRQPLQLAGRTMAIGASIGVAIARPGQTGEDVLHAADQAMYQHKHAGR